MAEALETISITSKAGEEVGLKELLRSWQIPSEFTEGLSERWQCDVIPFAADEKELAQHVLDGTPVLASPSFAARACEQVGSDALDYLIDDPQHNTFPRPKIAFVAGWGRPGSMMIDDEELRMVNGFSEVLEGDRPLNLQMFHRNDADAPRVPNLPAALDWPLQDLFAGPDGNMSVHCDMATRISARGALTWWHLDDGGEFVFQVGLPLSTKRMKGPVLLGHTGKPVVKLFVFGARDSYDLVCQDKETNKTHKFSHLDLFNTPTHHLPEKTGGLDPLPKLWVAPLEAGGAPLLSPPNVPHLVITLQHCVMVEQRVIHKLFLDEVAYFMLRAEHWLERPIFYPFLQKTLQDAESARVEAVEPLIRVLKGERGVEGAEGKALRARARESLASLVDCCGKLCVLDEATVEMARAALAQEGVDKLPRDRRAVMQAELLKGMQNMPPEGITCLPRGHGYAAHTHIGGGPRWAPVRATLEEAQADRKVMNGHKRKGGLDALETYFKGLGRT
mmetsp:Transcript_15963/g.38851  ORF Transcript_15963/g.38851 Transcript_15963/m.38851 type:complete len:505 (+) Transcript_15963:193-1707(+)